MFVANPFKFTKATLDGTKRGSLQLKPYKKVERHLWETHSDDRQWEDLGELWEDRESGLVGDTHGDTSRSHHGKNYSRGSQDRRQDQMVYHTKSLKCPKILEHLWRHDITWQHASSEERWERPAKGKAQNMMNSWQNSETKVVNLELPIGDRMQRVSCTFSVATGFFFGGGGLGVTGKLHLEEW